jgi:IS30 family transposase
MRRMYPDDRSRCVSHQSIYTPIYICPRDQLKKQFIVLLRQGHSWRKPRLGVQDKREHIPETISIHVSPPEADNWLMPGHREGDLIKGAGNKSAVGVLVERSTRLVMLCKMADAGADSALAVFATELVSRRLLRQIAAPLRQTLTYLQSRQGDSLSPGTGQSHGAGVLLLPVVLMQKGQL